MLALAALALGDQDASSTHTVSPVTVSPLPEKGPIAATVEMMGDDDSAGGNFVAIWPASAYQNGVDGHVTLSCKIDIHGLAEWCKVASETPQGKNLGKAALELRPTFQLKPATGADGAPVNAMMSINVRFKAPKKELVGTEATQAEIGSNRGTRDPAVVAMMAAAATPIMGNPLAMRAVTMLDDPVWISAASFDDLAKAYPAKAGSAEGYAAAHCRLERSGERAGTLRDCQVIKESPEALGFGKAALALAAKFRVAPAVVAKAPSSTPVWVDIPIRLPPPEAAAERTVMAPVWITGIDPKATPKLFPPEAVANGLTTGRGVARCVVGADGSLTQCAPESAEPEGVGFAEAAAKLATGMRMNLWSADGAPVEGGVIHVPVRLNLKGG